MNPTLLYGKRRFHAVIPRIESQLHPPSTDRKKRPALGGMKAADQFEQRMLLSALGATHDTICVVVVHTLRCHFITTTKLSKNTRPIRCPNWRKHIAYQPAQTLSTANHIFLEKFFRPGKHGVFHARRRASIGPTRIISAKTNGASHCNRRCFGFSPRGRLKALPAVREPAHFSVPGDAVRGLSGRKMRLLPLPVSETVPFSR